MCLTGSIILILYCSNGGDRGRVEVLRDHAQAGAHALDGHDALGYTQDLGISALGLPRGGSSMTYRRGRRYHIIVAKQGSPGPTHDQASRVKDQRECDAKPCGDRQLRTTVPVVDHGAGVHAGRFRIHEGVSTQPKTATSPAIH